MPATIITLGGALKVPNNIKVKVDPLDYPQALIIHDFSRSKTYPSQVNPIPDNTEFVNIAKGALASEGFVALGSSMVYNQPEKRIRIDGTGVRPPSDALRFGSPTAPYPLLGFEGQTTDLLVDIWFKKDPAAAMNRPLLTMYSAGGLTGVANQQINVTHGFVVDRVEIVIAGIGCGNFTGFLSDVWTKLTVYARCDTYNGKSGIYRVWKNGVQIGTGAFAKTAFLASNNTIPFNISDQNVFQGSIGRVSLMSGLDAAGLDPAALVAQDYAYGSQIWPNV